MQPMPPSPGPYLPHPYVVRPAQAPLSGMAVAGFIVALAACGLLGLILSIVGHAQVERARGALRGGGLARAGIIVGLVHLMIEIVIVAVAARGGNG